MPICSRLLGVSIFVVKLVFSDHVLHTAIYPHSKMQLTCMTCTTLQPVVKISKVSCTRFTNIGALFDMHVGPWIFSLHALCQCHIKLHGGQAKS